LGWVGEWWGKRREGGGNLKLSMACTRVGPFHQDLSSGAVGAEVKFSFWVPTAGSHCTEASRKPQSFRKGSNKALISSKRACKRSIMKP
jgi:hypothetical protein